MPALMVLLLQDPSAAAPVPEGAHAWTINSDAMAPTLVEGDVVLSDRMPDDCGTTAPAAGDVVLVRRDGAMRVRRVVAGPGQTVQMTEGRLVIDGETVRLEEVSRSGAYFAAVTLLRETLPGGRSYLIQDFDPHQPLDDLSATSMGEGEWFTMGDNRDDFLDDRLEGPTPAAALCGRVTRIVRSRDPARVGTTP